VTERSFESFLKVFCATCSCAPTASSSRFARKTLLLSAEEGGRVPVAAYTIIPAHTCTLIWKRGEIAKWRRIFDHGIP